jgi:hypothetical protein
MGTLERVIENYANQQIEKAGGWMLKFVSPGERGVPDDIALWSIGDFDFIEFKQEDAKPTPQQEEIHTELRRRGFAVVILRSKVQVDEYVRNRTARI